MEKWTQNLKKIAIEGIHSPFQWGIPLKDPIKTGITLPNIAVSLVGYPHTLNNF